MTDDESSTEQLPEGPQGSSGEKLAAEFKAITTPGASDNAAADSSPKEPSADAGEQDVGAARDELKRAYGTPPDKQPELRPTTEITTGGTIEEFKASLLRGLSTDTAINLVTQNGIQLRHPGTVSMPDPQFGDTLLPPAVKRGRLAHMLGLEDIPAPNPENEIASRKLVANMVLGLDKALAAASEDPDAKPSKEYLFFEDEWKGKPSWAANEVAHQLMPTATYTSQQVVHQRVDFGPYEGENGESGRMSVYHTQIGGREARLVIDHVKGDDESPTTKYEEGDRLRYSVAFA